MQNEAYQKLMDNLCDIVAEEQAKLGYMKEPIRLYYPLSSLNHFFGGDVSADEFSRQAAEIAHDDAHLKPQALALGGAGSQGLGNVERPGQAEADQHNHLEYLRHGNHLLLSICGFIASKSPAGASAAPGCPWRTSAPAPVAPGV